MIKVDEGFVDFEGAGIKIAAEYAALTHTLLEKYPKIMEIATLMIEDISKEIENDKTDFNNN